MDYNNYTVNSGKKKKSGFAIFLIIILVIASIVFVGLGVFYFMLKKADVKDKEVIDEENTRETEEAEEPKLIGEIDEATEFQYATFTGKIERKDMSKELNYGKALDTYLSLLPRECHEFKGRYAKDWVQIFIYIGKDDGETQEEPFNTTAETIYIDKTGVYVDMYHLMNYILASGYKSDGTAGSINVLNERKFLKVADGTTGAEILESLKLLITSNEDNGVYATTTTDMPAMVLNNGFVNKPGLIGFMWEGMSDEIKIAAETSGEVGARTFKLKMESTVSISLDLKETVYFIQEPKFNIDNEGAWEKFANSLTKEK